LEIVKRARSRFGAVQVSFSRSSVSGILNWLEAQSLSLIARKKGRVYPAPGTARSADTIAAVLAAAAGRIGNPLRLEPDLLYWIAASLLLPRDAAFEAVRQHANVGDAVVWIEGVPPAVFIAPSADPFFASLAGAYPEKRVS
jgi:hypothetical protein